MCSLHRVMLCLLWRVLKKCIEKRVIAIVFVICTVFHSYQLMFQCIIPLQDQFTCHLKCCCACSVLLSVPLELILYVNNSPGTSVSWATLVSLFLWWTCANETTFIFAGWYLLKGLYTGERFDKIHFLFSVELNKTNQVCKVIQSCQPDTDLVRSVKHTALPAAPLWWWGGLPEFLG